MVNCTSAFDLHGNCRPTRTRVPHRAVPVRRLSWRIQQLSRLAFIRLGKMYYPAQPLSHTYIRGRLGWFGHNDLQIHPVRWRRSPPSTGVEGGEIIIFFYNSPPFFNT